MIPVLLFHGGDFFVMLALRQSIQGGEFFPCGLPRSYQERWDFSKSSTLMGKRGAASFSSCFGFRSQRAWVIQENHNEFTCMTYLCFSGSFYPLPSTSFPPFITTFGLSLRGKLKRYVQKNIYHFLCLV